ncbi:hypothetical protein C8R46DRAFT_1037867 [Mycena filopes]|nr:hypothetical protein C8R46DRAFT_1037735 [Mycena filopes]KAJ7161669.1 hypothetical protein C8R46DRAFT_1037867 [Mycena filopes]
MRPWVLWGAVVIVILSLILMQPTPPSSSPSSLAQRSPRRARDARHAAMAPPYLGSRSPNRRTLQNISNTSRGPTNIPGPSQRPLSPTLDSQRASFRDADRERQLALQDTPSRRRRRVPRRQDEENERPVSPTPGASTSRRAGMNARSGSPTPGASTSRNAGTLNARSGLATPRASTSQGLQQPGTGLQTPPATVPSAQALGQQRRRERERQERAERDRAPGAAGAQVHAPLNVSAGAAAQRVRPASCKCACGTEQLRGRSTTTARAGALATRKRGSCGGPCQPTQSA